MCTHNVRFDKEAHGTFRRINAADDGEAQTLFAWPLLVDDCVKRVRDLRPRPARQRTKVGTFFPFGRQVVGARGRACANSQVATAVDAVAAARSARGRDANVVAIGRRIVIRRRVQRFSDLRHWAAKGAADAAIASIG